MLSPRVLYRHEGKIATLTLNRPRWANRIDLAMAQELATACQCAKEDGAWVVMVTGCGDSFSCGGRTFPGLGKLATYQAARCVAALPMPTLAAINGDALDQGLELALACDVRIAAGGVRLGLTQLGRGQLPWDGGTQRLARIIGPARALEMLLLSRVVDADEALAFGLVHRVVPREELDSTVREMSERIARGGPIAATYVKEAVWRGLDGTLGDGLRLEADLGLLLHTTSDRQEGVRSFLEKRVPMFKGE